MRRFAREARALSRLQHVNCVSVLDVGTHGERPYIVMELVAGMPLTEEIGAAEMTPARAVALMRQVLLGLGHAHGHGIIHRDLKPDNIMITELGGVGEVVKILDFGFAHINDSRLSQSNANIVPGTPSYMSPEQTRGIKTDLRTDLYSAGVLLYELCVGFRPFVAARAVRAVAHAPRRAAGAAARGDAGRAGSREALEGVILRALAKDPDARFAGRRGVRGRARRARPRGGSDACGRMEAGAAPHAALRGGRSRSSCCAIVGASWRVAPAVASR